MSATSLGSVAICQKMIVKDRLSVDAISRVIPGPPDISVSGPLPIKGFHIIDPPGATTAYSLAAGVNRGDVVEFLGYSGANIAVITPSDLHGVNNTVSITGGGYVKFIWNGGQWYLIGRCGSGTADAVSVGNYPALAV